MKLELKKTWQRIHDFYNYPEFESLTFSSTGLVGLLGSLQEILEIFTIGNRA